MSALKTINPEDLYSAIHQALRAWQQIDATGLDLFDGLLSLRPYQFDLPTLSPMQRRQAFNRFLADSIERLGEHEPTYARVLTRRFMDGDLIIRVARDLNVSEDQLNRLQREAIETLSSMVLGQEESLRANHRETQLAGLPVRPYTRLVGVNALQETLFDLLVNSPRDQILSLVGLGGIGKTALADGVVRRVIEASAFEELLWLRVDQPQDVKRQADQAAGLVFALAEKMGAKDRDGQLSVAEFRRRLHQRPHLVVIDNLEEELANPHLLVHIAGLIGLANFCSPAACDRPSFPTCKSSPSRS